MPNPLCLAIVSKICEAGQGNVSAVFASFLRKFLFECFGESRCFGRALGVRSSCQKFCRDINGVFMSIGISLSGD